MPLLKLPSLAEEKKLWQKGFDLVIGVDEVGRGSWAGPVVASAVAWSRPQKNGAEVARQRFFRLQFSARKNTSLGPNFSSLAREALKNRAAPPTDIRSLGINDSKALRSQKRRQLAEIIKECSLGWGIGEIGVRVIKRLGIGKATEMAMRKAIDNLFARSNLGRRPASWRIGTSSGKTFVLVDAFYIKYLKGIGLKNQKAIIKGDQKSISIAAASILAKVYRDNLMRKLAKKHPEYGWGRNKAYGTKEHQKAILKYGLTRPHRKKFVETFLRKKFEN